MEQFSGLLLILMLSGPFVPSKTLSAPTSRIYSFKSSNKTGRTGEVVTMMQGGSLNILDFCTHDYPQGQKVWCKGEELKECDLKAPQSLLESGWNYLTTDSSQKVILNNSGNDCVSISMSALQVEDSGTYWFGILYERTIALLRNINVMVHEGQQNNGNVTEISEKNKQRIYYIVLVLSSIAVGITIIAAITLVVMVLTTRKMKAADDLNFAENPNCRIIKLQINESNIVNNPLDKDMNTVFTIMKEPKSRTEDVTYVNTKTEDVIYVNTSFPLRSNIKRRPDDPVCVLSTSGSVEYATIIFESRVPQLRD